MGDDLDNNNNPSNEGTEPEVQETPVPQQTDPYDPGTYQIGDGRLNLKFVTYDTIEFVKDNGSVADVPIINIVPGEASGTGIIICGNEQEFNDVRNVPDKALAYRTDLNALFVRWQGAWMPVKTTSTLELEQGTPTFVTPNYAEKDKDETITGTWTFNENTTFKKDISSDTFQSGLNGWRLKDDSLEVENLTVRNKLKTNVFEIDKIKATNGSLYVSSCTTLTYVGNEPEVSLRGAAEPSESSTDAFTGTTYYVTFQEDVFEVGDIIQCHTSNKNYTAIVRASNLILLEADPVGNPAIEDEVVKINSTIESRNGSILLTSDLDNAPYIEVRKGDTAKVRLGNLSGINDLEGYGLYSDNAYLTGTFKVDNGNGTSFDLNTKLGELNSLIGTVGGNYSQLQQTVLSLSSTVNSITVENNIYAYTNSDEDISDIQTRWRNNDLTIDTASGYIKNYNNGSTLNTLYLTSVKYYNFNQGDKLYFSLDSRSNAGDNSNVIARVFLVGNVSQEVLVGQSMQTEACTNTIFISGTNELKTGTFVFNRDVSNELLKLYIEYYSNIVDFTTHYFRYECVTSDSTYYSLIKQTASSINLAVSNSTGNLGTRMRDLEDALDIVEGNVSNLLNNQLSSSDVENQVRSEFTGIGIINGSIIAATDNFKIGYVQGYASDASRPEPLSNQIAYESTDSEDVAPYKLFTQTMSVDNNGNLLTSGNASFKGNISAESGTFGIFEIANEDNAIKTTGGNLYFGYYDEDKDLVNTNYRTLNCSYDSSSPINYLNGTLNMTVSSSHLNKPSTLQITYPSFNQITPNLSPETYRLLVLVSWSLVSPQGVTIKQETIILTNRSGEKVVKYHDIIFHETGQYSINYTMTFTSEQQVSYTASYTVSVELSVYSYNDDTSGTFITLNAMIIQSNNHKVLINDEMAFFKYGNVGLLIDENGISGIKNGVITPLLS